ncbi:MAG TPA: PaaI family thioesterase [Kofleriaceae bacterium]|nr:PaaI family thioesterase [Kofleriaceae bacterium]
MSDQAPSAAPKTYLPTYDGCYVCGLAHPIGLRVRFHVGEGGKVHADWTPRNDQTGYGNIVHGGVISALLDELTGWPICLENDRICYTGELSIKFRKPVFAGQTYLATGYPGVRVEGKRYWDARSEVADLQGNVLAEATGRYFLVPEAQTRIFGSQMTFHPGDRVVFKERPPQAE